MEGEQARDEVAVIGAGSWGTALAIHTAVEQPTRLWTRNPAHAEAMRAQRRNPRYLSEFEFPPALEVHDKLRDAIGGARLLVWSVPSHGLREVVARARAAAPLESRGCLHLVAAKGVEVDSLATMVEVLEEEWPGSRAAALGGPSFAKEVAQGKPCAVVIGARSSEVATEIQRTISHHNLRAYVTEDVVGVELGGALKNVIAIAAGMSDGLDLGLNARAGLMTRGLAEIGRLARALGAQPETLAGLAGVGDLILTCTGGLSRNRAVGLALGRGQTLDTILAEMGMVAEGVRNTRSAVRLAEREGVEMPITEAMYRVLYEDVPATEALDSLMRRSLKAEH